MKISAAILMAAILGVANAASAQEASPQPRPNPEQRAAVKEKWQSAKPEERAAWKAQHPEAVERHQERRAEAKEKWKNATPEERQAKRQQFKTNHPEAAQQVHDNRQVRRDQRQQKRSAPAAQ
jgi:hypothetical protein